MSTIIAAQEMTEKEIFDQSPGFYLENGYWYAIFHAPTSAVEVVIVGSFSNWIQNAIPLKCLDNRKFWYLKVKQDDFPYDLKNDREYKFAIRYEENGDWYYKQDPAARQLESTNFSSNSLVTFSDSYQWQDHQWQRPVWEYYCIYQLHPKRFSNRNRDLKPLQQVEAEISGAYGNSYLKEMGTTAIQLLPVNAFATDNSWGYNGVFLYAIEDSYGAPEDLKKMVDSAHLNGIAVIIDVVFNHVGNGDNILWDIDSEEYFSGDTGWGPMLNFGSDVTRHFLIQNLLYMVQEYHIDGIRFDMTHILHKGHKWVNHVKLPGKESGWNFIKEMRHEIKAVDPKILLIAEELPDNWYVTSERVNTSWGGDFHGPFDSQWCDAFHDNVKEVLKGGHLDKLKSALTHFGDSWHDALNYSESHDEVGNMDERIAKVARDEKGWEISQVAAPLTFLARGIPMIFMGQEGGEWTQFGQNGQPHCGGNWWDHRLNLDAYINDAPQNKIRSWYQKILEIRRHNMWAFADGDIQIKHVHDDNGVIAFTRCGDKYLIALNFKGQTFYNYDIGVSGFYKELANSSWPVFNIINKPEASRQGYEHHQIDSIHIPSYGAVVLERY